MDDDYSFCLSLFLLSSFLFFCQIYSKSIKKNELHLIVPSNPTTVSKKVIFATANFGIMSGQRSTHGCKNFVPLHPIIEGL